MQSQAHRQTAAVVALAVGSQWVLDRAFRSSSCTGRWSFQVSSPRLLCLTTPCVPVAAWSLVSAVVLHDACVRSRASLFDACCFRLRPYWLTSAVMYECDCFRAEASQEGIHKARYKE